MSAHPHSREQPAHYPACRISGWSLFLLVPFLIVFKLSLSQTAMSQPPYTPLFDPAAGLAGLRAFIDALSFENYRTLFSDTLYIASFLKSLQIALISTLLLMAAALPIAYGISRMPRSLAAGACHRRHAAVLDRVPDPHLCLDHDPAARGPVQPSADRACASSTSRSRSSPATPRSISASSILICRSWCCRSMRCCRKWTTACSMPPPISAARAGKPSGW